MEVETIKERLTSMGYECTDADTFAIQYTLSDVEQYIKHFCNISEVPACLEFAWIDMVCGKFLQTKKSMGQLTALQFEPLLRSIRDGDTTVEYNNSYMSDPETFFNNLMEKLIHGHDVELIAHRKLRW